METPPLGLHKRFSAFGGSAWLPQSAWIPDPRVRLLVRVHDVRGHLKLLVVLEQQSMDVECGEVVHQLASRVLLELVVDGARAVTPHVRPVDGVAGKTRKIGNFYFLIIFRVSVEQATRLMSTKNWPGGRGVKTIQNEMKIYRTAGTLGIVCQ